MSLTTIEYTYSGQTTFALPFALGVLSREHVTAQVNGAVDGVGEPLATPITWVSDTEVSVAGLVLGDTVLFTRKVSSTQLYTDFTQGADITHTNLINLAIQPIMLHHELVDDLADGQATTVAAIKALDSRQSGFEVLQAQRQVTYEQSIDLSKTIFEASITNDINLFKTNATSTNTIFQNDIVADINLFKTGVDSTILPLARRDGAGFSAAEVVNFRSALFVLRKDGAGLLASEQNIFRTNLDLARQTETDTAITAVGKGLSQAKVRTSSLTFDITKNSPDNYNVSWEVGRLELNGSFVSLDEQVNTALNSPQALVYTPTTGNVTVETFNSSLLDDVEDNTKVILLANRNQVLSGPFSDDAKNVLERRSNKTEQAVITDALSARLDNIDAGLKVPGKNLVNPTDIREGFRISPGARSIVVASGWRMSGFIPVNPGDVLTYTSVDTSMVMGFFSEASDTAFVSSPAAATGSYTRTVPVGQGIKFVAVNISNEGTTDTSFDAVQLELSATPTPYEPYELVIDPSLNVAVITEETTDRNGEVGGIPVTDVSGIPIPAFTTYPILTSQNASFTSVPQQFVTPLWMVLQCGQSLSVGAEATPLISTGPYGSLMMGFIGGAKTGEGDDLSSLQLFREDLSIPNDGGTNRGETGLSEVGRMLTDDGPGNRAILTACGFGGQSITFFEDDVNDADEWFDNVFVEHVRSANTLAIRMNTSLTLQAINWMQGESSQVLNSQTEVWYDGKLRGLKDAMINTVKGITGQTIDPIFVTYQTSSKTAEGQASTNTRGATYAQLAASQDPISGIVMSGPVYAYEHAPDGLHLSAQSSIDHGKVTAAAIKGVLIDKTGDGCPKPLSATLLDASTVLFDVTGNVGAMQFDTTLLPAIQDNGFKIVDTLGDVGIESMTASVGSVTILTSRAVVGAWTLRYAIDYTTTAVNANVNVGGGNLRAGGDYPRWMPHFELAGT